MFSWQTMVGIEWKNHVLIYYPWNEQTAASDGVKLWDLRKLRNFRTFAPYDPETPTNSGKFVSVEYPEWWWSSFSLSNGATLPMFSGYLLFCFVFFGVCLHASVMDIIEVFQFFPLYLISDIVHVFSLYDGSCSCFAVVFDHSGSYLALAGSDIRWGLKTSDFMFAFRFNCFRVNDAEISFPPVGRW